MSERLDVELGIRYGFVMDLEAALKKIKKVEVFSPTEDISDDFAIVYDGVTGKQTSGEGRKPKRNTVPKSAAERAKAYRERKKAQRNLMQAAGVMAGTRERVSLNDGLVVHPETTLIAEPVCLDVGDVLLQDKGGSKTRTLDSFFEKVIKHTSGEEMAEQCFALNTSSTITKGTDAPKEIYGSVEDDVPVLGSSHTICEQFWKSLLYWASILHAGGEGQTNLARALVLSRDHATCPKRDCQTLLRQLAENPRLTASETVLLLLRRPVTTSGTPSACIRRRKVSSDTESFVSADDRSRTSTSLQ